MKKALRNQGFFRTLISKTHCICLHSFTPKTTNVSTPILLSSTFLKTSSLQCKIVLFTLIFSR